MDTSRHQQELKLLSTISTVVDQSIDMRAVVHPILKALDECLGFRAATITILKKDTEEIFIEAAHGVSKAQADLGRYKLGDGVTGQVVLKGEPMVIPRTSESHLFLDRTKQGRRADTSFICVPIKERQNVVGALSVFRPHADSEQLEQDKTVIAAVASMLAHAVRLRREVAEQQRSLQEENRKLKMELTRRYRPENIIGTSHEMQQVYDQIAQVAGSQATVLIHGETGTGKELVAHAIHYASDRRDKPFVRVHCAALPEGLIESELFGHVKGAFTGAVSDRKGRFELADGGTIFLDEIGEVPITIQAKLLRVLQEREFERVGGTSTIKVDVRIVAATHRDLPAMVENGTFREDLYYRLSVFPIYVPCLASRKSDIILLADHFLAKYAQLNRKEVTSFSNETLDLFMRHTWPGNVRELENCIERGVLLTQSSIMNTDVLPPTLLASQGETVVPEINPDFSIPSHWLSLSEMVENYERKILERALEKTDGNISAAARELCSTPRIISYKVKQYNLKQH
jgi:Nif-specific regulatory protein